MHRVLRDSSWPLRLTLTDADGEPVTASAVEAAVTDDAGDAITGSPFTATAGDEGGEWLVTIPASATATLGVHDVTWAATIGGGDEIRREQYEVVAGFTFELAQLRGLDNDAFADPAAWPGWKLRRARDAVEDKLEDLTAPSFRLRRRRVALDGSGTSVLMLPDLHPQRLVAATVDDVALDAGELADVRVDPVGWLVRDTLGAWGHGTKNVVVTYEHGYPITPEFVEKPCLKLARSYLADDNLPDRATGEQTPEGGIMRFTVAGRDGPTGVPEFDALVAQFPRGPRAIG